ncbi:MAG: hypothetical protein Q8R47_02555 [Nanoarchaeota archaeon]|nr:hypothetical protein [Nanoarchaeota archaeon]
MNQKKGRQVVVDGLDGVGKGVFLGTFVEEAKKEGKRVYDIHEFWKNNDYHPSPTDLIGNFDVVITSEPTFCGIGRYIRNELIARNGRSYSPRAVAEAYALDRHILYEQLLVPLLQKGIDVYQSRSFSSSITFQRQSALDVGEDLSIAEIMSIPGNKYCAEHPMDYLAIPTIKDAAEVMQRLADREKDDNCKFENLEFQLKLKPHFESEEFRNLFASLGVKLAYMDAGVSIEYSKQQAREFYQQNLR